MVFNLNRKHVRGFTLIETILASLILCLGVMAVTVVGSRSMGWIALNRQYEQAFSIADRQLTMIDYMGVEEFINLGRVEGQVDLYETEYFWAIETEAMEIDNLYGVMVTISWFYRGTIKSIEVESRLNGKGILLEEEEESGDEQGETSSTEGSGNSR